MIQNFGSKPQISCKIVIDIVIIIGFLYFIINFFIALNFSNSFHRASNKVHLRQLLILVLVFL